MNSILPQQRLFLELLIMSGNIALPDKDDGTLLFRTMLECQKIGWITLTPFGSGFSQAKITVSGRKAVEPVLGS